MIKKILNFIKTAIAEFLAFCIVAVTYIPVAIYCLIIAIAKSWDKMLNYIARERKYIYKV